MPGLVLPPYRVRARNLFRDSPNRVHEDGVARAYGFPGGLVAGTTVYGYLTHPVLVSLGSDWLRRGTARIRLRRPVLDGDEVTVKARVAARSGGSAAGELLLALEAATSRAGVVAAGLAGLAWGGPPVAPDPDRYRAAALPAVPPPASVATLEALDPLGTAVLSMDSALAARAAGELDDPSPRYRGPDALAHPALLLQQANRALAENVGLGPWVHVESDVAHLGLCRASDRLETRGRVVRVFERRRQRLVELDLLVVAAPRRPVLHVRHTAIWALAPAGG